jgi:hypothetical protein
LARHSQNQRSNHREEHCRKKLASGQIQKYCRHFQAYARFRYDADNDSGRRQAIKTPKTPLEPLINPSTISLKPIRVDFLEQEQIIANAIA